MAQPALKGLRVIEMGQLLAGPFCAQLLGDFGAEVIKIEPPNSTDPMRDWGQAKVDGHSLWWPIIARNKKCITLNARHASGQELVKKLVSEADVLVENFRPGTMEKWGLGYEELSKINPRLIMVRVSGYGQDGPYSQRPGYASIGEALGGLRNIIGYPDRAPCRTGISLGDSLTGMFSALGALVALQARHQSGVGQQVDAAIYESVFAVMESLVSEFVATGYTRGRTGAVLPKIAPANVYPTKDGEILIAANQNTLFKRLAIAMGQSELAESPRYATHNARGENQEDLDKLIAKWTVNQDSAALAELLNAHDIPNGKTYTPADIVMDAHFKARDAIIKVAHPLLGSVTMQNVVPKLSATPGLINWCGPNHGEHNEEVYKGLLGLNDNDCKQLRKNGVI